MGGKWLFVIIIIGGLLIIGLTWLPTIDEHIQNEQNLDSNFQPKESNYNVTLYSANGTILREYKASSYTRTDGGIFNIIGYPDGNEIALSGTVIITEN